MTEYERLQAGAERIVEWFRKNRKSLPWRENITPYKVWVSEIMLQQTRIEAARSRCAGIRSCSAQAATA